MFKHLSDICAHMRQSYNNATIESTMHPEDSVFYAGTEFDSIPADSELQDYFAQKICLAECCESAEHYRATIADHARVTLMHECFRQQIWMLTDLCAHDCARKFCARMRVWYYYAELLYQIPGVRDIETTEAIGWMQHVTDVMQPLLRDESVCDITCAFGSLGFT